MRILLLVFVWIGCCPAWAQKELTNSYRCLSEQESHNERTHETFLDKGCANKSAYWIDNRLYIPKGDEQAIYIKLNFIFLTKPDGTGNFEENNSEHVQFIDELIDRFNWRLSTLMDNDNEACYTGDDFVPDTKIQVLVNKIWIVDSAWDLLTTGYDPEAGPLGGDRVLYPPSPHYYYSYLDTHPDVPKGVNIVFVNNGDLYEDLVVNKNYQYYYDNGYSGEAFYASQFPTTQDLTRSSRQLIPDMFNKHVWMKKVVSNDEGLGLYDYPWSTVRNWHLSSGSSSFPHELGHTLWLFHQYCQESVMNPKGSASNTYLTPWEIGKMQRAASISNVRQFFTDDSYTSTKILVNSDETWDVDRRIYSDIQIDSTACLKLTCNLVVPPQSTIYVTADSHLILEGAQLTSAVPSEWKGIQVEGSGSLSILPGTQIKDAYFYAYTGNGSQKTSPDKHSIKETTPFSPEDYNSTKSSENDILVYPNPFKDNIYIEFSKHPKKVYEFTVVDVLSGIPVYKGKTYSVNDIIRLDRLREGVYCLIIATEKDVWRRLLIKD